MNVRIGSNKGFTLVEVLIVIAIIAIGSVVSVPMLNDFSARYRLRGAARDVTSVLQLTRLEAIKRKDNCGVVFGGAGDDMIAFVDSEDDSTYDGGEEVLSSINLPDTILLDTGAGGLTFVFNPRGLPNSGGNIILNNNIGGTKVVNVGPAGRARIQ